jgi:hypothetical protein
MMYRRVNHSPPHPLTRAPCLLLTPGGPLRLLRPEPYRCVRYGRGSMTSCRSAASSLRRCPAPTAPPPARRSVPGVRMRKFSMSVANAKRRGRSMSNRPKRRATCSRRSNACWPDRGRMPSFLEKTAPYLRCPICSDEFLRYVRTTFTFVGPVERWDELTCPTCGSFEFHHAAQQLRTMVPQKSDGGGHR